MARVLIVDDSGLSRRTLRRILEAGGHEVVEAEDGIAALEQHFLEKPDVVFLDLTMAGMHGMDVLTKLREMDAGARVVIATADIQSFTKAITQEAGAGGFVNKPFDPADVLTALDSVLTEEKQ